jgi:hypothetical protein
MRGRSGPRAVAPGLDALASRTGTTSSATVRAGIDNCGSLPMVEGLCRRKQRTYLTRLPVVVACTPLGEAWPGSSPGQSLPAVV